MLMTLLALRAGASMLIRFPKGRLQAPEDATTLANCSPAPLSEPLSGAHLKGWQPQQSSATTDLTSETFWRTTCFDHPSIYRSVVQ